MDKSIETIIIGGGQGGLSASYFLQQAGREHLVLEKADRPGHAWREQRWDSFTLVTPNWTFRLPGAVYWGADRDGYMPRDAIVRYFEDYAQRFNLPVRYGVSALSVEANGVGYKVTTDQGAYRARNVIVATGLFQQAKIPSYASKINSGITQITSAQYRRPDALPPGAVLVAGSAQSGCQIAEELYQSGRKVYLCVGSAGRAPRRYRGRDIFEWLVLTGFLSRTPDKLPSPQARFAGNPQVSGKDGGHTLNLHRFARDGVTLLGKLRGAENGRLSLAPDLKENLARVDQFEVNLCQMIDQYIQREGLQAPEERLESLTDGYGAPELPSLDLKQAGICTIIWTMGFHFDFSLVKLPVFDDFGFPITDGGVSRIPGLYFCGLPWLPNQSSGIFLGVGENAARVTEHLCARDKY